MRIIRKIAVFQLPSAGNGLRIVIEGMDDGPPAASRQAEQSAAAADVQDPGLGGQPFGFEHLDEPFPAGPRSLPGGAELGRVLGVEAPVDGGQGAGGGSIQRAVQ